MYRYTNSCYNKLLLNMGCIRVGTLHDFRKSEHKKGIADPQEGKKEVFHHIKDSVINLNDGNSIDDRAAKEFRVIGGNGSVHCKNVIFSTVFDEPDCYILCVSDLASKSVMDQFEGADSCVQIADPTRFYKELTDVLNSITPVIFRGVHKVIYQNKKEQWNGDNWGEHPALIKEPEFFEQYELRAIWQPKLNTKIEPVILGSYALGSFCKSIEINNEIKDSQQCA